MSLIKEYDVEVDLQEEGFPTYRCTEIGERLEYLEARLEVRQGRTFVDLRVRAIDERTARAYARRRVAMELSA
ncbi:MAG TPA: hypothetical protein VGI06_16880 [Acidimicrobiales bacterium]